MSEYRAKQKATVWAASETVMHCKLCGMLKGWKRDSDGDEREISESKLRGAEDLAQSR